MRTATGFYINVYNRKADVFLIVNEANGKPACDDINTLEIILEDWIDQYDSQVNDRQWLKSKINESVEKSDISCVDFGYQIIIR